MILVLFKMYYYMDRVCNRFIRTMHVPSKQNYSNESFDCVSNSEFATNLAMGSGSVFQEFLEQIFTYTLCANIHTSTFGPYSLLIITHLNDSPVAEEKRGLL